MANLHCRKNSLPSKFPPVMDDVEDRLCRLKASEATSTSATSVLKNLADLRDLQEGINNMIQLPSIHQLLTNKQGESWTDQILNGSLSLVDLCEFSRDVSYSTKESVQDLESSIRRNRGETDIADNVNAYESSRKKINKRVNKYLKEMKIFKGNSTAFLDIDCDLKVILTMMKETEALGFSVLRSVLTLVSAAKGRSNQRSRTLFSKFIQVSRVQSEVEQESGHEDLCSLEIKKSLKSKDDITVQNILKQLKASETTIQELEEGLEALFRSLVKTRVSLLNVLSH